MKKILSFIITMMMICNVFFTLGSNSYAAEENIIEVSNINEFKSAMNSAEVGNLDGEPTRIKLLADISNSQSFSIYNKYISIDLNNHTLICGLLVGDATTRGKVDIYNGTLKSNDVDINYAPAAANIRGLGELNANKVNFIGGSSTVSNATGGYGIQSEGKIYIESCVVRSGDSGEESPAVSAFNSNGGSGTIKNCEFIRGKGIIYSYYPTVSIYGDYKDGDGNTITTSDEDVNSVIIGKSPLEPSNPGELQNENIDVKGTYINPTDEILYSVDISWGDMNFEYIQGKKGTWDPSAHKYGEGTTGTWDYKGTNTIQVVNHSNTNVKVKLSGSPEEGKFKGDSSFVFCSDENLNTEITEDKTIVSAVDLAIDAEELKYKSFLKINGEMNSSEEKTSIGNVTVEISN